MVGTEPSAARGVYSSVTLAHQTVPWSLGAARCWTEVLRHRGVSLPGTAGFGGAGAVLECRMVV